MPSTTAELTCFHEDVFYRPCLVEQDLKEKRLSVAPSPVSVIAVLCCDFVRPEGGGKVGPPVSYPVRFLSCLSLLHTHILICCLLESRRARLWKSEWVVQSVTVSSLSGCRHELEPKSGNDSPPVPDIQASGHPAMGTGMSSESAPP